MNYLRILVLIFMGAVSVGLTGCASDKDPYKGMSEGQIYTIGQTAMDKGRYDTAVSAYEALEAKYPYGEYAHSEQLNIIYAYYQSADYVSAQSAAERYIHLNPQSNVVDYAYYMKAMSAFAKDRNFLENFFPVDPAERDLQPMTEAFSDFNYVVVNYPQSPYAGDSRLHMVYIRNAFARNNLRAAEYYYTRSAYVAALNRVHEIVFHYQGSPSTAAALKIMYQCYQKLNLPKDANATLAVIKLNYPDLYKALVR